MRGAAAIQAYPMEDLYYQASTRGGREIDKILAGKAQFKATTGGVGSFLADTSVALASPAAAPSAPAATMAGRWRRSASPACC